MTKQKRDEGARGVANDDASAAVERGGQSPQPDHSEREWGGDQDIDTAGMIPGNKATDDEEPTTGS